MDRTHYPQLTLEERYHIQVMRKQGKSLRSIAIGMGRIPIDVNPTRLTHLRLISSCTNVL